MQDVKAGRIATLYVYRLDRFSRSVADFGQLWQVLQANRVEFVSVSENFDTSTPMGRAMLHIIMVFAQLERETTAQRVRDNYYRRAALGTWPGGPAPFGFDNGRAAGRDGRRAPALVPNGRGELVRRIFAEYAGEGTSLSGLAKKLSREGIPGAQAGGVGQRDLIPAAAQPGLCEGGRAGAAVLSGPGRHCLRSGGAF